MNDTLEEMQAEIARQDEAFAAFEATLRALGDVELAVPHAVLEELDELARPRAPTAAMPLFGIRG